MKKPYEAPEIEVMEFEQNDVIVASSMNTIHIAKTPAWLNCTHLPSGDPITHYTPAAYFHEEDGKEP